MYPVIFRKNCFPRQSNSLVERSQLRSFFSDGADYSVPAANIKETDKSFEIEVAAPGLKKEDFQIKLDKNILTVSSVKKSGGEETIESYTRREFSYSTFSRSFFIPDFVNQEGIKATCNNGILSVELPKLEETAKAQKEIKIS